MVSCRFITENSLTHKFGDIQDLRRCAYKRSPSRNGWGHTNILHRSQIRRTTREHTEVIKRIKPQKSGYLVHEMIDGRTFKRQLSIGHLPIGHPICADKMFL